MTEFIFYIILIGILSAFFAFITTYFIFQSKNNKLRSHFAIKEKEFDTNLLGLKQKETIQSVEIERFISNEKELKEKEKIQQNRIENLLEEVTKTMAEKKAIEENLSLQKKDFEKLEERFREEFENLAGKILKQNTVEFTETQQRKMNDILTPLKEKLQTFEKKVEDTYEKGLKDQTDMRAELKKLYDLNARISTEANNLTKALKSDSKQQGNWGELVLERILDRSGLTKGIEYEREQLTTNEDGQRIKPDVIVKLPDNKHIIIDSKVSLIAYERAVNAEDDAKRMHYIKEHIQSVKAHIKGLGAKHYQTSKNLNSPDFVLLFIPIESSFALAVQEDTELFNTAWENNIVLVSPSTLLATLRTVSSIWKQEKQTQNVQEIAKQGAALYDKFVGFTEDLLIVGKKMNEAKYAYEESMKKLSEGNGNLVKRVENLRKLGALPKKAINPNLLKHSIENE